MRPTQENIEFAKASNPDRDLYTVDVVVPSKRGTVSEDDEAVMTVLMTSPSRDEHRFFTNKVLAASELKDESDKVWAMRAAVENAALAQIRWPDRDTVKAAFNARPEMVDQFAEKLREMAGTNVELRTKKL